MVTTPAIEARFIEVDGIRTRYFELGTGEPLVLWHGDEFGGLASASTWKHNLHGLSEAFHVFAADRLGQGFTDNPKSDDDYTVEAVVQHMHGFIRAIGLERVHLIGQSRGAYLATRLTLEQPGLVKTLVIVDTATLAPGTDGGQTRLTQLLADVPSDPREYARFRWTKLSYRTDHITDDYLDEAAAIASLPKMQAVRERVKQLLQERFLPSLARQKEETLRWINEGRLQVPTLIVWGRNDPLAPLESGLALFDLISKHVSHTRMYIFNHAGHYPYREYPDEFNTVVTDFIRSC